MMLDLRPPSRAVERTFLAGMTIGGGNFFA